MTKSLSRSPRWIALAAVCAALVTVTAALPAGAAARQHPAPAALGVPERIDPAVLRASLGTPGDGLFAGAMARVGGRDGRWTGTMGAVSADPDASFRIGSVTKLFTSTVVLQLVAEGRLSLDTPVQRLLPGTLPAHWQPITVAQLISHTSGLPRAACWDPHAVYTPADLVRTVTECPEAGEPITGPDIPQVYNGVNYFLLGMVVEKVTHHSYAHEVSRRIVRPLGLRHTYVPAWGETALRAPALAPQLPPTDPWPWAEGGMVSDAPDLERFLGQLLRGRLLPPAQQKLLFELPRHAERGFTRGGVQYAKLPDGTEVYGKSGSYGGYTNGVFATRDLRRSLVYSLVPLTTDDREIAKRYLSIADAAF
ncbi:serine hydrolase [Streptomyces sp. TLI_105]|uniref:serine hydrolase domain-containing protein n=1 Tax=Streptomyces sp. TLI_105 TaxID=1881019 RepID=UPI000896CD55|nr:serine hydrolase domain-containing protein [Streptomyces sp. TLI_105]SED41321.1 D-alanyl-D-alanine carboxypeptidase [Streptomyces sp. TLI_105]